MSRVGRQPVKVPAGVKASVEGNLVRIEGPRGKLEYRLRPGLSVTAAEGVLHVSSQGSGKQAVADYGSARAHLNNMVAGVTKGWKRALEINGVGYAAKFAGETLAIKAGHSHEVNITMPREISCQVQKNVIELVSHDKQLVGNMAAAIRKVRPPEPYLGKGIKFVEEVIKRKAGKTTK